MARTRTARVDPGALLATTHALPDGKRVRLRLTRPSDVGRIRTFLEGLSPDTRRLRFFSPMPTVPEATVRHFTFYDPRERLVIAATAPEGGTEQIVGLADLSVLETGLAELALVIDDAHQRRGIGRLLAEAIARLALQRGATHAKAEMLSSNAGMLKLMQQLGHTVRAVEHGNVVAYAKIDAAARRAA